MNTAAVLAALNITILQLYSLMRNRGFPIPTSNDGNGNLVFNSGAIVAFGVLMASAKSRGWRVPVSSFPTANWSMMAATPTGSSYRPSSSFLFDY
jgi:hypothetical protein